MNLFGWLKRSKLKREIIVNVEKLETRVAVLENGRLEEFMVEHPEAERLVGSIFKGRVQNLENDLQAAFVDIGLKKNAFLHYWDMTPDADALLDEDDEPKKGQKGGRKLTEKAGRGLFLALLLFVGIPLPGTGAWTGTLAASLLDMDFKSSVIAVMLGVVLAGIIMGIVSMGLFGAIFAF